MKYDFNIFNHNKKALPVGWSKPRILAFLKAILKPVQLLEDNFVALVSKSRREANFTGQVIYLEHLLNDKFDPTQRRIYIDDGQENILPPFVFNKIEDRPNYLYNKSENKPKFYLYNKSEFFTSADFVVFVPSSILTASLQIEIERQVNYYKQAGKIFEVQGF